MKITVACTTQHNGSLFHIAMHKGYFTAEGLVVQPVLYAFGKQALDAVLAGKADLATVAETPVVFATLNGNAVTVVCSIFSSTTNNGIAANRKSGISLPEDLRGKRIGFTPHTTSEFFLDSFLTSHNIERREVTPIALKPDEMLDALVAGRVDAASTWNYPLAMIRKTLEGQGTTFFDSHLYNERFLLAGKQETVKRNPEAVRRMLRALLRAERFTVDHPREARAIVGTFLKIDDDILRSFWNESEIKVSLDQMLLITMEDETRWAMKNRLVTATEMPNYLNHIYFEGLEAVAPDAVTIRR